MKLDEYLDKVAYVKEVNFYEDVMAECYFTKFDDSYLIHKALKEDVQFLADLEITEELSHGLGFSPKDNKWYGWTHRGIFGFTVGSEVKKYDVAYKPVDIKDALDESVEFWHDEEYHEYAEGEIIDDHTIKITWKNNDKIPNKAFRERIDTIYLTFDESEFGVGEWTAKTMEDAKQMATDYRDNLS